jgi:hypothetical protein
MWRVIFFLIWEFGVIALVGLYTLFLIDLYFKVIPRVIYLMELGIIFVSILIIFSNIMILLINTRNQSPGALDNASGMAIIFELSSFFKDHKLNNFNLWFFLDSFDSLFSKDNTFQINFDMISGDNKNESRVEYIKSYGLMPPKRISGVLKTSINNAAREENVYVKGFNVLSGAHTDSIPFHLRKYDSVDFATFNASRYSHSPQDTPDKVNPTTLFNTCKLVARMIINLDNKFESVS